MNTFPPVRDLEKLNLSVHGITIALAVILNDVSLLIIPYVHATDSSCNICRLRGF